MSSTNPSPSFTGIQYNPEFYKGGVTTQNNKWTGQNTFTVLQAVTPPITENSIYVATTEWVKDQAYLTENVKKIVFVFTTGPLPGTPFAYAEDGIFFINTLTSNEVFSGFLSNETEINLNIHNTIVNDNIVKVNLSETRIFNLLHLTNTKLEGSIYLPIETNIQQPVSNGYIYWGDEYNPNSFIVDNGTFHITSSTNVFINIGDFITGTTSVANFDLIDTYIYNTLRVNGDSATFLNPPNMSGANIETNTIPDTALSSNVSLSNSTETITGIKTFNTPPTMSGANIQSNTIPDTSLSSNVSLSNSNENITGIKSFATSTLKVANQYFNGVSTLRTGAFTVSSPYYEIYPLAPTVNMTITLPPASASLLGIRIRFRRVGGTITTVVSSSSSNIYPNNSFTPNNVLLASNVLNNVVTCMYLTSTTYGWFGS
jgi:hypothetical protein